MEYTQALALLLYLAAIGLLVWGGRRRTVAPLLVLAMVVFLVLWNVLPLVLQSTIVDAVENSPGPWTRNQLSLLQAVLLLAVVLAHLAFPRPYFGGVKQFFDEHSPSAGRLFGPSVLLLGVLIALELRINSVVGTSFADNVSFALRSNTGEQAQVGILETLLSFIGGYFLAIISLGTAGGAPRRLLAIGWIGLLSFSVFALSRGIRAVVLLPVVAAIVAISTLRGKARTRATVFVVVASTFTILIGGPAAALLGIVRAQTESLSVEAVAALYTAASGSLAPYEQVRFLATEVNRKFDEVGPGVELLALEPAGTGGITPILSAAVAFVPRAIYPNKPVPTSRDGTYYGIAVRIAATAYGDPELGMVVPVSSTAMTLWELDTLGPLVLVLLNLLFLLVLNTLLVSHNVFTRALAISVMGVPTFQSFVGAPSLVVQTSLRLMLLVAILFLVTLFVKNLAMSVPARD